MNMWQIKDDTLKVSGNKYEKQKLKRANGLKQTNRVSNELVNKLWKTKRENAYKRRHTKH